MQWPSWKVLAGSGAAVAAVAAVVVVTSGDDGPADGCLSSLVAHLPPEAGTVSGTDIGRARDAGLALDGTVEEIGKAAFDTSLRLDPLTARRVQIMDDGTDDVGYGLDDLRCWLGEQGAGFAGRGSFDGDAVADSPAGQDDQARVSDDLIAYDPDPEGDLAARLDPSSSSSPSDEGSVLAAAVDVLDRHGIVTFDLISAGDVTDGPWVGLGLAAADDGGEGDWDLVGVWAFADPERAVAEEGNVADAIAEGDVGDMLDGDPVDLVHHDGRTLWMRAPLVADPADWTQPIALFDPVLTVVADFADGN
ncbi:MAG TPA: hypothetical protein VGO78_01235 [Acidimicrobiales bacterium]|nr:hypothetical protein [Acidimicrobiales bacterium]